MEDRTLNIRMEHDTMGEIAVPADRHWGAQTQRSVENFKIGGEKQPKEIITAFAYLKEACAKANAQVGKLTAEQAEAIASACQEIRAGMWDEEFPLVVWQTGSGTQTNMNMNEVLAHLATQAGCPVHPNDQVNCSQSSNDTFPSAMSIAATLALQTQLIPAVEKMERQLAELEQRYGHIIKIGRTHLQDATPLTFGQEISGWRAMMEETKKMLTLSLPALAQLAIGGTAVGTGLNAPADFDHLVAGEISAYTGVPFTPDPNKFHALTSKDAFVFAHGAMKALAANLMKIANDIRWLASGPRCGLGELSLPANEPGSSIMPGKVNPTQCEAVTMVAVQVMGNDTAVGIAASQGNFQLNVFMPVCAYNFLQSARLLTDCIHSFTEHCLVGLQPLARQMKQHLDRSLMLVTCLSPRIGYEAAAEIAHTAHRQGITLKEAALQSGKLTEQQFDQWVDPQKMV